jgi:hypothetical protein
MKMTMINEKQTARVKNQRSPDGKRISCEKMNVKFLVKWRRWQLESKG